MKKFHIEFSSILFDGAPRRTYTGTVMGAKRRATSLYSQRLSGPWTARIYDSVTGKLIASRIGLNPWRDAQ